MTLRRWIAVACLAAGLGVAPPAPAAVAQDSPDPAVLSPGGAWCWFSDPRSVYVATPSPTVYTAAIDTSGRVVVSAYDLDTQRLRHVALMALFTIDDHNNPSLLVAPDGNLTVFWSGHNESSIFLRSTTSPGDLRSFGAVRTMRNLAPGDTVTSYTNPVRLASEGGRTYLFFRSGLERQAFVTSDDGGATWSPGRALIEQPGRRPYVKYGSNGTDTIAMAYTDDHPDWSRSSVYYSALRAGQLVHADGSTIRPLGAAPMRPAEGDLLWDANATGVSGWVHDVALDPEGHPVVVFATIVSPSDHRYHYARFDGTQWHVQELTPAGGSIATGGREPSYSAGISLDHADPSTVYLARPEGNPSVDEIERWHTTDNGASWEKVQLTHDSTSTNVRPVHPRDLPVDAPMQAVWMRGSYPYFTTFDTSLWTSAVFAGTADATSVTRISTSARVVHLGAAVTVSARVVHQASGAGAGGREVTLAARPPGLTTWHRVGAARTGSDGLVRFTLSPTASRQYAVLWPGDEELRESLSSPLLVDVQRPTALRISAARKAAAGSTTTVSGRLVVGSGAGLGGRRTTLVSRRAGTTSWTRIGAASTAGDGLVVYRVVLRRTTEFRVQFDGTTSLVPSTSAVARVPVA